MSSSQGRGLVAGQVNATPDIGNAINYYDRLFASRINAGIRVEDAIEEVTEAYLDGRPALQGKVKTTSKDRNRLFWVSQPVKACQPDDWRSEPMVLALARYLGQEPVTVDGLLVHVARAAPAALVRAARCSGLVRHPQSLRRTELQQAASASEEVAELCRVLDIFKQAHRERVMAVDNFKESLATLSAFDLLMYASLYAFEHLVPRNFHGVAVNQDEHTTLQLAWDAIGGLLAWKLAKAEEGTLRLTEDDIGRSISRHLRPLLFDVQSEGAPEAIANLHRFNELMAAQIELNEFEHRSADAFSYDDGILFVRKAQGLEIVEVDAEARASWHRDGLKLKRLHGYWLHRAFATFRVSDVAGFPMGRPENEDANRLAWLRALHARLQLKEVYGVADEVTADSGETVDLFRALVSLNLMSAHFLRDFLAAFTVFNSISGDWLSALGRLALDGLIQGNQNRLPLTWSSREAKIRNIRGRTVTADHPKGSTRMAAAILDFWTHDMVAESKRLKRSDPGLAPRLFERPVLKFGEMLVQLPWLVGMQNNSIAAINNLRRIGARRGQARQETQRIETELAQLFENRGFKVLTNWQPPAEFREAGEVDVISLRDGHLFVLEVKSTFVRRSQHEAWLHATTTLRKAGRQLRKKIDAVLRSINSDAALRTALAMNGSAVLAASHGWIVDTSIECDHERFSGFLKISVEELLIALRDDRHLLSDPEEALVGLLHEGRMSNASSSREGATLYPDGFGARRFVEAIETSAVWAQSA